MARQLDERTLRWAARKLRRAARKDGKAAAATGSGYIAGLSAAADWWADAFLLEARSLARKPKAAKKERK